MQSNTKKRKHAKLNSLTSVGSFDELEDFDVSSPLNKKDKEILPKKLSSLSEKSLKSSKSLSKSGSSSSASSNRSQKQKENIKSKRDSAKRGIFNRSGKTASNSSVFDFDE